MTVLKKVFFETTEDFLREVLLPSGCFYSLLDGFIFRGHSKSSFQLVPSFLRFYQKELQNHENNLALPFELRGWARIQKELNLLRDFYTRANHNGLKLPNIEFPFDNLSTEKPLANLLERNGKRWPLDSLVGLMALAQHHKVQTRLLDWTTDILVACYFACVGTLKRLSRKGKEELDEPFSIFALDVKTIKRQPMSKRNALKFIVPPYAENPNLKAQKGLFTYWELMPEFDPISLRSSLNPYIAWNKMTEFDRYPLETLLEGYSSLSPLLYKFSLPARESILLFRHLQRLEYGAARLFPGYDGVVKEISENEMFKTLEQSLLAS